MITDPEITPVKDDGANKWRLDNDVTVDVDGYRLVVPRGFTTDLSSVPRAFWSLIAPFELSVAAPLVHDFLYEHAGKIQATPAKTFCRADADAFLRDIAILEGCSTWRAWAAYYAVRAFGPRW